jgi:hypothetical protein
MAATKPLEDRHQGWRRQNRWRTAINDGGYKTVGGPPSTMAATKLDIPAMDFSRGAGIPIGFS